MAVCFSCRVVQYVLMNDIIATSNKGYVRCDNAVRGCECAGQTTFVSMEFSVQRSVICTFLH